MIQNVLDAKVKFFVFSGKRIVWKPEDGTVGERIFVPDSQKSEGENGCLLTFVPDAKAKQSTMYVVDAQTRDMVVKADVLYVLPFGFHGMSKNRATSGTVA
eukprot:gb/GEZJ01005004.1/.p1 GENE.gb/GEZJ01005004.1/~~gb/GEZJ01005004.1/.p1  ORF type:complete len:101 (-),score=20.69 gb/GEZJ01005004.1/:2614-2916(-)